MTLTSDRPVTDAASAGDGAAGAEAPGTVRTLRRIDAWTVLRVSLLFYACLLLTSVLASVILWTVASAGGVVDNVEDVVAELFALEEFSLRPAIMLRAMVLGGVVMVFVASGANVVLAVLYNLIAELTGGVGITLDDGPPPAGRRPRFGRRPES